MARAEDRGLGIQTWEWARHMDPAHVLIVGMGELARGFPAHLGRYDPWPNTLVEFDGTRLDETLVRQVLAEVDVLYCAETWYDDRLPEWCHDAHVVLVCHVNPEFFRWHGRHLPAVRWWLPTVWRFQHLPASARVVPVPVPLDRWPDPVEPHYGPARFLHVAGHRAAGDRNGTNLVMAALGRCRAEMRVEIATQDPRLPDVRHGTNVELARTVGGEVNYWDLYAGHDVLVMPRRYGGLCLPANEAAGAGLGLVMSDASPNGSTWPAELVPVSNRHPFGTPGGTVTSHTTDSRHLARVLDMLARDHDERHRLQAEARRWAVSQSWARLEPLVREELALACG